MRLLLSVVLSALALTGIARAAPPLEAYGKLPALDLVRLSPSGNRIAFVAVDGETRKLFVRNVDGDAILVSPVGTSKIRDLQWAGEDYVLVDASYTFKAGAGEIDKWSYDSRVELGVIIIANLKSGTVTRALAKEQGETFGGAAINLGPCQENGRWFMIAEAYNRRLGQYLYKVDLDTGAAVLLPKYEGVRFGHLIGGHCSIVARAQYIGDTREWRLLAGAEGNGVVVARHSDLDTIDTPSFGRTSGSVLVSETGPQKDTYDEYRVGVASKPTPLFEGQSVETFLDAEPDVLIGAILDRGRGGIFFDPQFQHRYDALRKGFSAYRVTLESFSDKFDKVVVKTDGGDDSGTYWLVDLLTGKAEDLMPAYPSVEAKDVGPTSIVSYSASDGLALEGVLTLPPGSAGKNLPVVVMPHGGPIGVYDWLGFDYWAQAFASRGYAVFQPNYRGSGGYGAPFRQAGFGQWGGKMLSDISDGLAALIKAGIADPKRACIVGASYGGYAALAEVTFEHQPYRCAVAVSPVSDVGAIMHAQGDQSATAQGRYSQALFGASFAGATAIAQISPLNYAASANAPILLIHGKDDSTVPFVHSLSMKTALERAGKTVEFLQLEGEDHFWSHEATRIQILNASVAFVQKYNPAQ